MDAPEAPNVTSLIALVFAAAVAALIGFFDRRKAKRAPAETQETEARVLAGSVVDGRSMRDATDAMRAIRSEIERFREQQHEDSRNLRSAIEDMTMALKRNTEAQDNGAVTPREMAVLLGQMKRIGE